MHDDSSTRSWDSAADDWIAHADTSDYQNLFLQPRMLALAGDVAGRRVLDLGCGEGAYSRELARRGARVTGIDGSATLIDAARQRAEAAGLDIDCRCLNANALTGFVEVLRDIFLVGRLPNWTVYGYTLFISAFSFYFGYWFFDRYRNVIVDVI